MVGACILFSLEIRASFESMTGSLCLSGLTSVLCLLISNSLPDPHQVLQLPTPMHPWSCEAPQHHADPQHRWLARASYCRSRAATATAAWLFNSSATASTSYTRDQEQEQKDGLSGHDRPLAAKSDHRVRPPSKATSCRRRNANCALPVP